MIKHVIEEGKIATAAILGFVSLMSDINSVLSVLLTTASIIYIICRIYWGCCDHMRKQKETRERHNDDN